MGPDPNPLKLHLLGGFELRSVRSADAAPLGRKVRALLAYLALSPDVAWPREKLMALLWSDRSAEQARASLRQALTELRQAVGEPSPLRTAHDMVSLNASGIVVDAVEFTRLANVGAWEQAAALYRGPLLDGHGVHDDAFEDWILVERTRLHDLAVDVFERFAASQSGEAAIATAQHLLQLDPMREETHRLLMRLYAAAGLRAQALRQYEHCRDILQRELRTRPDEETDRLYRKIRNDTMPAPALRMNAAKPEQSSPADGKPSIAVLPFAAMTQDAEQEAFADGLTEDLITDLSRTGEILVTARHSCFAYKGKSIDVRRIAEDLGVRFVLDGSARRVSQRVRINVQLVDAATGKHLWAERYDRSLDDVFLVQDEVAAKIVEALAGRLIQRLPRKRPKSMEAWDCCVMARRLNEQSPQAALEARVLLERALEIDPDYAEAHRWLAANLWNGWVYWGEPIEPTRRLSSEHAERAIALDPDNSGCHWVRGTVLQYERRFEEAEQEFAKALELDPNDADCWAVKSDLSMMNGYPERALEEVEKAFRLDPAVNWYHLLKGQAQYALSRYEEAASTLRQELTYRIHARRYLAASLAQLGRIDEARHEAKLFMATNPGFRVSYWMATQPFQDRAILEKIVEGYRKAGLPE